MKKFALFLMMALNGVSAAYAVDCDSRYFCKDKFEFDIDFQQACTVGIKAATKTGSLSDAEKICNRVLDDALDTKVCKDSAQDFLFYCR